MLEGCIPFRLVLSSQSQTTHLCLRTPPAGLGVRGEHSVKAGNGVPHSKLKRLCTSELAVEVGKNSSTASD